MVWVGWIRLGWLLIDCLQTKPTTTTKQCYPHYYCMTGRDGNPVYIERSGQVDQQRMRAAGCGTDELVWCVWCLVFGVWWLVLLTCGLHLFLLFFSFPSTTPAMHVTQALHLRHGVLLQQAPPARDGQDHHSAFAFFFRLCAYLGGPQRRVLGLGLTHTYTQTPTNSPNLMQHRCLTWRAWASGTWRATRSTSCARAPVSSRCVGGAFVLYSLHRMGAEPKLTDFI